MQRSRINRCFAWFLVTTGLVAGCNQPPQLVYVDSNLVAKTMSSEQLNEPIPSNKTLAPPSSASPMNGTNLPQLAEKEVTSNRTADILELKAKLEQENKEAIQLIFERLKEFYQQELDDFREEESQKLNPTKQENVDKYLQEYRIIFNKYAQLREPILVELSLLLPVPNSTTDISTNDEDLTSTERTQRTLAKSNQESLKKLEDAFEIEISALRSKLDLANQSAISQFENRMRAKQKEIEDRAMAEARNQVTNFSEEIEKVMFLEPKLTLPKILQYQNSNAASFKDGKGFLLNSQFETLKSTILKEKVQNELQMWARIRHYQLSETPTRGKDVTADFLKWRQSMKMGGTSGGK